MTEDELNALASKSGEAARQSRLKGQYASAICYEDIAHNVKQLLHLMRRGDGLHAED